VILDFSCRRLTFALSFSVFIRRVTLWTHALIVGIGLISKSSIGVSNMYWLVSCGL
jgi:hypothetical protein